MKRKIDTEELKLSQLLFNKSKNLVEKLQPKDLSSELDNDKKPAWLDDDDVDFRTDVIPNTKDKGSYSEKLKQKYASLNGTPKWAQLGKRVKHEDDHEDMIRKSVGHLTKQTPIHLPKDHLEIKRFPKINSETGNEGPVISCVEFHPKISAAMVAGNSGVVSLFSIGGDVNNKLHSFKLKKFRISAAHFNSTGTEAFFASKLSHDYCIYDLVKAVPKLIQFPDVVKRPIIFEMSRNGKYIATSSGYNEVYLMSSESRELLRSLKHNNKVESVSFSHDSEQMYSYCVQGEVYIWDLSTFRVVKKFFDHGCVTASCILNSPCGRLLATGSGEGIVNIYETTKLTTSDPLPLKTITNLTTKITNLKFNATTEILAASSSYYPTSVKLVHIPSYHVFQNFPKPNANLQRVHVVNFSPNSGYLALGNNKTQALLFRLKYYKNY